MKRLFLAFWAFVGFSAVLADESLSSKSEPMLKQRCFEGTSGNLISPGVTFIE